MSNAHCALYPFGLDSRADISCLAIGTANCIGSDHSR